MSCVWNWESILYTQYNSFLWAFSYGIVPNPLGKRLCFFRRAFKFKTPQKSLLHEVGNVICYLGEASLAHVMSWEVNLYSVSCRKRRRPRKPGEKDCLSMTHPNMLEATSCKGAVRHQCAARTTDYQCTARNSDYKASILKHPHPRDNDYAYAWDSPQNRIVFCDHTNVEAKIVPIHMDTECLEVQEEKAKIISPTPSNEKDVPFIFSTLPKDSNTSQERTSPLIQPSSDVLTSFQGSVHFDPDIVPLSDTQTSDTFHTLPPCNNCEVVNS